MLSACPEHAISRSGHAPSTATSRTEHAPSIAPFPYPEEQDALTGGGDSPEDVLFRIPSKEGELEVNNVKVIEQELTSSVEAAQFVSVCVQVSVDWYTWK